MRASALSPCVSEGCVSANWAPIAPPPPLRAGRLHEAYGQAARVFAAWVLADAANRRAAAPPAVWILSGGDGVSPYGLARFFDPTLVALARVAPGREAFAAFEDALRCAGDGVVVIAETGKPADLTQSRRLQLAAGASGATGVLLAPNAGRPVPNAAETRWRAQPAPCWTAAPQTTEQTTEHAAVVLTLEKNKRGAPRAWRAAWAGVWPHAVVQWRAAG